MKLLSNNIMISESLHDELGMFRQDTKERISEIKDTLKDPVGKDRTATGPGHGTMEGKDTPEALAKSGRLKGQSGR